MDTTLHEPGEVLPKENQAYIFTKTIRLKNGRVLYASQYGLKAFKIPVN